jgi:peptide/nickel transport system permease protein
MATVSSEAAHLSFGTDAPRRRGTFPRALRSLLRARLAAFGVVVLTVIVLAAVFAHPLALHNPSQGEVISSKLPPAWMSFRGKSGDSTYPLGTDENGRDIYTRIIYGARVSLTVGVLSVLIGGAIGVTLGLISGYYRGPLDDVIMRLADIQLAIPSLLLAIALLAVLGQGLKSVILAIGVTTWVTYARVVRGQVLSFREKEFVEAARAMGAGDARIMIRHILPNTWASIIVIASFGVASAILIEAALSFLGLSVPPTTATWGNMVADAQDQIITGRWWLYVFPGAAIMLTVLSVNSFGDWLRDFLDPRLQV